MYLPTLVLFQACQKNHSAIDFPKAYTGNSVQLCLNLLSSRSHDAELDPGSNWFCSFISFHVGVALPPSFILGLMGMVDSRHQYTDDVLALNNWYILWPLGWLLPQALSPVHYYSTAACAALPSTFCLVHSGWATVLFSLNCYNVFMSAVEHLEVVYEFCMKHYQ